jgi:transcriptional regulator with XRE-family HTH domain
MLGQAIRRARLAAGLTQEELAFRAKVSRQYISLLELNQKNPTVSVLVQIAHAMGASAAELVAAVEMDAKRKR